MELYLIYGNTKVSAMKRFDGCNEELLRWLDGKYSKMLAGESKLKIPL